MPQNWWTLKNLVLVATIAALVCVVAFVAIGLVSPEPVSSAELGPDWQCSRLAFIWTTCTRITRADTERTRAAREPLCTRPRVRIAFLVRGRSL